MPDGVNELVTTTSSAVKITPASSHPWVDRAQVSAKIGQIFVEIGEFRYLPTLWPVKDKGDQAAMLGAHSRLKTIKEARAQTKASKKNLHTNVCHEPQSWTPGARLPLRGLIPLDDAILCVRDYQDLTVQAEIEILYGEDREAA